MDDGCLICRCCNETVPADEMNDHFICHDCVNADCESHSECNRAYFEAWLAWQISCH